MVVWLADNWLFFLFWGIVSWLVLLVSAWRVHVDKRITIGWILAVLASATATVAFKVLFILSLICNALVYLKS